MRGLQTSSPTESVCSWKHGLKTMGNLNPSCESRKKSDVFYLFVEKVDWSDLIFYLNYCINAIFSSEGRMEREQEGTESWHRQRGGGEVKGQCGGSIA